MKHIFYAVTAFLSLGVGSHFLLSAEPSSTLTDTTRTQSRSTSSSAVSSQEQNDQNELAGWVLESGRVAQDYVEGLDRGQYAESWSKGDQLFQHAITKEEWIKSLNDKRKPLGKMNSRKLKDHRFGKDPRGLPKGPYMVVEYDTSFATAPTSVELLTLRRGTDGKWRVLTYQVN